VLECSKHIVVEMASEIFRVLEHFDWARTQFKIKTGNFSKAKMAEPIDVNFFLLFGIFNTNFRRVYVRYLTKEHLLYKGIKQNG